MPAFYMTLTYEIGTIIVPTSQMKKIKLEVSWPGSHSWCVVCTSIVLKCRLSYTSAFKRCAVWLSSES